MVGISHGYVSHNQMVMGKSVFFFGGFSIAMVDSELVASNFFVFVKIGLPSYALVHPPLLRFSG